MNMRRKAQVTIFILLALLLLAAAAVTIMIRWNATQDTIDVDFKKSITDASSVFSPVDEFITSCLAQTTKAGIKKLGLRGGLLYAPSSFILNADDPVNSDGVAISTTVVPYWVHARTPAGLQPQVTLSGTPALCKIGRTSCITTVNSPSPFDGAALAPVSIEEQLERYVAEELPRCLDSFSELEAQGFSFSELGELRPTVAIRQKDYDHPRDGDVFVGLYYPLIVSYQGIENSIDKFTYILPFDFAYLYRRALELATYQLHSHLLEDFSLNLVSLETGIDTTLFPPTYDSLFFFDYFEGTDDITWNPSDVALLQEKFKAMLVDYTSLLRVLQSAYFTVPRIPSSEDDTGLYNNIASSFIYDVYHGQSLGGIDISFLYYPDHDPYFSIKGKDADGSLTEGRVVPIPLIQKSGFDFLDRVFAKLLSQRYESYYTFSYPVLTSFKVLEAFDGKDYDFKFAMEGNVYFNHPASAIESVSFKQGRSGSSLFCDKRTHTNEIHLTLIDAYDTQKTVSGVTVSYACGTQSCEIGTTDENGLLRALFPSCFSGGVLTYEKDGSIVMKKHPADFLPSEDVLALEDTVDVRYPLSLDVVKIKESALAAGRYEEAPLSIDDDFLITFRQDDAEPLDNALPVQETVAVEEGDFRNVAVSLLPGDYEVTILMTRHQPYYLPQQFAAICEPRDSDDTRKRKVGRQDLLLYSYDTHPAGGKKLSTTFPTNIFPLSGYDPSVLADAGIPNAFTQDWQSSWADTFLAWFADPSDAKQNICSSEPFKEEGYHARQNCNLVMEQVYTKGLTQFMGNVVEIDAGGQGSAGGRKEYVIEDDTKRINMAALVRDFLSCDSKQLCDEGIGDGATTACKEVRDRCLFESDPVACMNTQYRACITSCDAYFSCLDNLPNVVCNSRQDGVLWVGGEERSGDALIREMRYVYAMDEREYAYCTAITGEFCLGLQLFDEMDGQWRSLFGNVADSMASLETQQLPAITYGEKSDDGSKGFISGGLYLDDLSERQGHFSFDPKTQGDTVTFLVLEYDNLPPVMHDEYISYVSDLKEKSKAYRAELQPR